MTTTTPKLDARQQQRFDAFEANIASATAPARVQQYIDAALARGSLLLSNAARSARLDAAGFALGEELRKISAFNVRHVEQMLKCRTQIPEVPDPPGIGYQEYAWNYISHAGEAAESGDLVGNFPQAVVQREGRNTVAMDNIKASYGWDDLDLARAALVPGFQLPTEKAQRAARMIAEKMDDRMYLGSTARGITGLLSATTIVGANFNQGAVAALSTYTADQLFEFYRSRFNAYLAQFNDAQKPAFHCLLPFDEYMRVKEQFQGDNDKWSIEQKLLSIYGGDLGFQGFDYNVNCSTAGTGSTKMLCIYPRDGMVVGRVVATEYTEAAPDRSGFTTSIKCYGRHGGVAFREPTKVHYAYGL